MMFLHIGSVCNTCNCVVSCSSVDHSCLSHGFRGMKRKSSPALPRGGRHERAAIYKASSSTEVAASVCASLCESDQAIHQFKEWSWGRQTAPGIQCEMSKAYNDQVKLLTRLGLSADHVMPELRALAKMGNWGTSPQNCHDQLLNHLGQPITPPPTCFPIKYKVGKKKGGGDAFRVLLELLE